MATRAVYDDNREEERPNRGTRNIIRTTTGADRPRFRVYESKIKREFEEKKSVEARAQRKREVKKTEQATKELHGEDTRATHVQRSGQIVTHSRTSLRSDTHTKKKHAGRISMLGMWVTVTIATVVCYYKAIFTLLSFGLFGTGNLHIIANITVDDVIETFTEPLVWVGVMEEALSFSSLGIGMFAFIALVTILSYLFFWFYYRLIGVDPLGTVISTFVTATTIAFDLIPPLSFFPWMVLWVLYMNATAVFLRRH